MLSYLGNVLNRAVSISLLGFNKIVSTNSTIYYAILIIIILLEKGYGVKLVRKIHFNLFVKFIFSTRPHTNENKKLKDTILLFLDSYFLTKKLVLFFLYLIVIIPINVHQRQ